jgi:hypothetical protein
MADNATVEVNQRHQGPEAAPATTGLMNYSWPGAIGAGDALPPGWSETSLTRVAPGRRVTSVSSMATYAPNGRGWTRADGGLGEWAGGPYRLDNVTDGLAGCSRVGFLAEE